MEELEIERAKKRFEEEFPNCLPEFVMFRDKLYRTIDAERYQGLVVINLDDDGKVLRADSLLCQKTNVCPTCGQAVANEEKGERV